MPDADSPSDPEFAPKAKPPRAPLPGIETLAGTLVRGDRLIGLDLGDKTIGIALSDVEQRVASAARTIPPRTLPRSSFVQVARRSSFDA